MAPKRRRDVATANGRKRPKSNAALNPVRTRWAGQAANAGLERVGLRVVRGKNTKLARVDRSTPGYARVVATADIPKDTFVATYPGWVYHEDDYKFLWHAGHRSMVYSIQSFRINRDTGAVDWNWILDPTDGVDHVAPEFRNSLAPFLNEPSAGQRPNLGWVYNFDDETVELWTIRAVRAGEELLLCYGAGYRAEGYGRSYKTGCRPLPTERFRIGGAPPRPIDSIGAKELNRARKAVAKPRDPPTSAMNFHLAAALRGLTPADLRLPGKADSVNALEAFHRRASRLLPPVCPTPNSGGGRCYTAFRKHLSKMGVTVITVVDVGTAHHLFSLLVPMMETVKVRDVLGLAAREFRRQTGKQPTRPFTVPVYDRNLEAANQAQVGNLTLGDQGVHEVYYETKRQNSGSNASTTRSNASTSGSNAGRGTCPRTGTNNGRLWALVEACRR